MRHRQFCPLDLPNTTLPPQLPHSLDNQKNPPHTWMIRRKATTISINWQLPTQRNPSALHKRPAFALLTKPQILKQQEHRYRERIINHGQIDIARSDSSF